MKQLSKELTDVLDAVPYEQLRLVDMYVGNLRRAKYQEWEKQMQIKWADDARKREAAQKKFEKQVLPAIKVFLRAIKPGTLLKMKGCRDGKGIRHFLQYDDKNGLVECRQVLANGKLGGITTHMDDKVQGWFFKGGWNKDFSLDGRISVR